MMNEITTYQQPAAALDTQMQFAKAVTASGGSILPRAYQGNMGNALIAINLGASMGLAPAESLYRIDVIQGVPTASAELVASNVRKAGHKLRVRVDDQSQSVTAEIIRADDPEYVYSVTRDMQWAQKMGLASKDNYKKQPMTMLQWRAITAVARLAASEALYGVGYTADEIQESSPAQSSAPVSASTFLPSTTKQPETGETPTEPAFRRMFAILSENGLGGREEALGYVSSVVGREITSRSELTAQEVARVSDSFTPTPEENNA